MPKITQVNHIDISPKKFLDNCSREELIELELLLSKPYYQMQMEEPDPCEVSLIKLSTH